MHREKKKPIIIHGIRESQETDAIDIKRDDTNIVVELCEFVNVDAGVIKNVVRLGKKINGDKNTAEENTDKSRSVKVTLSDIEEKQMLMKNLSKLKHAPEHSQIKKMSVTNVVIKGGQPAIFASNCSFLAGYFSMNKKNVTEKFIFQYISIITSFN